LAFPTAAQPSPRLGLYKIFVYFEAVVHESTILSFPPPTCIAHPGAILLHGYWTVYDSPSDLPFLCYTPYNIGNKNIEKRLSRDPRCLFVLQDDFKFLARKISKKVLTKGGPTGGWDSKTQGKVQKYVSGAFERSFTFARAAGEEDDD